MTVGVGVNHVGLSISMYEQACQQQEHWKTSGEHRVQGRGVLWQEEKRVIRENSEHVITALSKAVWQAGTKGNIFQNALKNR